MPAEPRDSDAPPPRRRSSSLRRRNIYDLQTRPDRLLIIMFSMLRDEASKPYVNEDITLNTDQSQKIFQRVFAKLSEALYRSDTILTQVAPKEATTLHRLMDKSFEELYQKLTKEDQRVDVLCQGEGIIGEAKYTSSSTRNAIIYSPRARRFMLLLEIYDRMVRKLDLLHLYGILGTAEWMTVTYDWRRDLFAFANAQIEASNEAMRAARQKLEREARELRAAYHKRQRTDAVATGETNPPATPAEAGPSEQEFLEAVQHDLSDIARVSEHDDTEEAA